MFKSFDKSIHETNLQKKELIKKLKPGDPIMIKYCKEESGKLSTYWDLAQYMYYIDNLNTGKFIVYVIEGDANMISIDPFCSSRRLSAISDLSSIMAVRDEYIDAFTKSNINMNEEIPKKQ